MKRQSIVFPHLPRSVMLVRPKIFIREGRTVDAELACAIVIHKVASL